MEKIELQHFCIPEELDLQICPMHRERIWEEGKQRQGINKRTLPERSKDGG